jgi:hypothetical protein
VIDLWTASEAVENRVLANSGGAWRTGQTIVGRQGAVAAAALDRDAEDEPPDESRGEESDGGVDPGDLPPDFPSVDVPPDFPSVDVPADLSSVDLPADLSSVDLDSDDDSPESDEDAAADDLPSFVLRSASARLSLR